MHPSDSHNESRIGPRDILLGLWIFGGAIVFYGLFSLTVYEAHEESIHNVIPTIIDAFRFKN